MKNREIILKFEKHLNEMFRLQQKVKNVNIDNLNEWAKDLQEFVEEFTNLHESYGKLYQKCIRDNVE